MTMRIIFKIIRRWEMHRLRKRKADVFLERWDRARNRLWITFQRMPENIRSAKWLERNHRRLWLVCENQARQLSMYLEEKSNPQFFPRLAEYLKTK
jgi:hypothetical protein